MDNSATDELAVRRAIAEYSDAVWRLDADAFGALWAENGQWCILGNAPTGRDAIIGFWTLFMGNFKSAWQVAHTMILDIGSDRGCGRVYINEIVILADGTQLASMGIYHDDYVKIDDRWLFERRHFDLTYMGPANLPGRFFETAVFGPGCADPNRSRPATPPMSEVFG